jgi:hypothetical protein
MTHNRESWLSALAALMRPEFAARGLTLPPVVRVSCGWPCKRALSSGKGGRTIGQCFNPSCSADGSTEVFISPVLSDSMRVADVLCHELIHAAMPEAEHKAPFAHAAKRMGLTGKPTATEAGPEFLAWAGPLVESLGAYPHATLDLSKRMKVQTTRMIKAECPECGYTARTTRKWLDAMGAPLCPCNAAPMEVEA